MPTGNFSSTLPAPQRSWGAHVLKSGISGAPVCSDTNGAPPRRSDTGWLQMLNKSAKMTSGLNA